MNKHEGFMVKALEQAMIAYSIDEVPIGAIIVKDEVIVGMGYNVRESHKIATGHAEIQAIESACKTLGGWRLTDCDMYVTIEPCVMCAGAIYQSRIRNLYIGSMDPKAGACGSVFDILTNDKLNHKVSVVSGVLAKDCSKIMKDFFRKLRT